MAQVINTNVASLNAQRHLNSSRGDQEVALERLSSGLRINSARDDAAGLAISERFTGQINGMDQAARNANDGISFAQTAEGAMEEMSNLLQRVRELAVQSANDTNSPSDRAALDREVQAAVQEIGRIAESTQFNQQNVLNGTLRELVFQVGANRGQTINASGVDVRAENLGANVAEGRAVHQTAGGDGVQIPGGLQVNGQEIDLGDARDLNDVAREVNERQAETGVSAMRADRAETQAVEFDGLGEGERGQLRINDRAIELDEEVTDMSELAVRVNDQASETGVRLENGENGWSFVSNSDFELEYISEDAEGAISVGGTEIGQGLDRSDEDSNGLIVERGITLSTEIGGELRVDPMDGEEDADLGAIGLKHWQEGGDYVDLQAEEYTIGGVDPVDVRTRETASDTIVAVDFALQQINNTRADLGAIQSRFDATINNLNISSENLSASRSRILDADFAEETAEMTRTQILQQAGTSVLGQANEIPQQVAQLLQQ